MFLWVSDIVWSSIAALRLKLEMTQTLYKLEHCNLGEEVKSDHTRKSQAADALMSKTEREAQVMKAQQCTERERESDR